MIFSTFTTSLIFKKCKTLSFNTLQYGHSWSIPISDHHGNACPHCIQGKPEFHRHRLLILLHNMDNENMATPLIVPALSPCKYPRCLPSSMKNDAKRLTPSCILPSPRTLLNLLHSSNVCNSLATHYFYSLKISIILPVFTQKMLRKSLYEALFSFIIYKFYVVFL